MSYIDREEFEKVVRPVIKYLNENHHPHTKIIIDIDSGELVVGEICIKTEDYFRD